jgi:hypothetical protein
VSLEAGPSRGRMDAPSRSRRCTRAGIGSSSVQGPHRPTARRAAPPWRRLCSPLGAARRREPTAGVQVATLPRGTAARPAVSTAMETRISGQYAPIVVSRSCAASCGPRIRPMSTAIEVATISRIITAMTKEKNSRLTTRRVTTADVTRPAWACDPRREVACRSFRPRFRKV